MIDGGKLFNEDTEMHFKKTTFKNIVSSSKSIFKSFFYLLTMDECTFENMICSGEADESSVIEIDSLNSRNKYKFNDLHIINSRSNGNIIKVYGDYVDIEISGLLIDDVTSYGSIIYNNALQVHTKLNFLIKNIKKIY